jgi:hypothetical protein
MKSRSPKFQKGEKFVVGPAFANVSDSTFRHFQGQGIGVLCFEIPEIVKRYKNFGESTFWVSTVEGSRNSKGEVMKSRNLKFRICEGCDPIFKEIWVDASCLIA